MYLKKWILEWGYLAVFLGSMIEGESIIVTAAVLASMGYLSIQKILAITFCGTLLADQGLFFLGTRYGDRILNAVSKRWPAKQVYLDRAFGLIRSHKKVYIFIFRFIYGIRILSPLVIGASGQVSKREFAVLNFLAAIVWTLAIVLGGFYVGKFFHKNLKLLAVLGLVVFVVLLVYLYKKMSKKNERTVLPS